VLIWDSFHFRGFGDAVAEGAPACAATVQAGIITVRSGKSLLPDGQPWYRTLSGSGYLMA